MEKKPKQEIFHKSFARPKKLVKDPVKEQQEKDILHPFFELIERESDLCSYGMEDTLFALDCGAVKTIVICK